MNKYSLTTAIFLSLTFSTIGLAQTPTQTPVQKNESDIVKISTNLIQVDVSVTDKKGNPVTDLKPEDFEISENGEKQDITNFSYISIGSATSQNPEIKVKKSDVKTNIPLPPVKLKAEQVRRTYALIVDDLGLSFASSYWVKEALKKFVNEQMQEGDLVAILRVSGGIGALQSFTSDKRLLMAAVNKIRWNGLGRIGVSSYEPLSTSLAQDISGIKGSDGKVKSVAGIQQMKGAERQAEAARQSSLAMGTLGSLNYVIRGMKELPGRKSLMLFSEGFQVFDYANKMPSMTRIYDLMRDTVDLANRSSVVIYTLDPRGLDPKKFDDLNRDAGDRVLPEDPFSLKDSQTRTKILADSGNTLRYLANETGGIPYVDQNDLNAGIQQVLDDVKGYYLLGYEPDSDTFDPKKNKFNTLNVKVKRPGLNVRYRSGFFGTSDEEIKQNAKVSAPQQQLASALASPFGASEISLNLYPIFYNDDRNRNFIRALVYIDPKDLNFAIELDGIYRATFDIVALVVDTNGASAGNKITTYKLQFTKDQLAKAQEKGIIYDLSVPIIKTGAYQFRVALRDTSTGKIGAASQFIEIPDLDKKKLTLSNLVVNNYSREEWKKISLGQNNNANAPDASALVDTTSRQFTRGSVFTYSFIIYNAKADTAQKPQLQLQTRLFYKGKMIMEGNPARINVEGQKDLHRIETTDAITLGTDLQLGDYVLQVAVSDNLANEKSRIAAQSIDFEIIR